MACTHQVVADRIEAGTFLCAVRRPVVRCVVAPRRIDHLEAVVEKLRRRRCDGDGG
jgi:UDP-N-acetylglucosamine 1-carboxyvinyltransferase